DLPDPPFSFPTTIICAMAVALPRGHSSLSIGKDGTKGEEICENFPGSVAIAKAIGLRCRRPAPRDAEGRSAKGPGILPGDAGPKRLNQAYRPGPKQKGASEDAPLPFRCRHSGSEAKTRIFVFELRHAAAGIHQLGRLAGPCRMRQRVDVERHGVAFFAPGRAGLIGRAVGHFHFDEVIFGVNALFHLGSPYSDLAL